jgi:hypothetical protein
MEQQKDVSSKGGLIWESAKPFVFGGIAGMLSTSIIQPLDFFKVLTLY